MIEPAWREASAWRLHSPEVDRLRVHQGYPMVPVFDLLRDVSDWTPLDVRPHWLTLPPHPNMLVPVVATKPGIAIQYAALAWQRGRTESLLTIAKWGCQLVDVFEHIRNHSRRQHLGLFLRPRVRLDVGHHVRVGFLPLQKGDVSWKALPADIRKKWPTIDESALVFVVGDLLSWMSDVDDSTLEVIIERARSQEPRRRFATLRELARALHNAAGLSGSAVRTGTEVDARRLFDEGAGWYELGRPAAALPCFEKALALDPDFVQAREGAELARWATGLLEHPDTMQQLVDRHGHVVRAFSPKPPRVDNISLRPASPAPTWDKVEGPALMLESMRDTRRALDLYRSVQSDPRTNLALFTARARCHLQLGESGEAIDYAQRALAIDGAHAPALDTLIAAMLANHWHEEALRNADRLVDLMPSHGRAHYLRGKALFANGRMPDAREAFARATELDPQLLEAQLLRREVERVTGNVRQTVGKQHAPTFDIPDQLAELRDVLVSGDTRAAITALGVERYARDADAQLLLARLLAFDHRFDAAFAVYDQLVATSHRTAALVGKATALLELGRPGDALAICEQLPDDADALETAARALAALGRFDDAAEAYRRFIALASRGSDLRVRSAQLALDDIAARRRP